MSEGPESAEKGGSCSMNCKAIFSDGSKTLTLACPLGAAKPKRCFSVLAFWNMHLDLRRMAIRSASGTRVLSGFSAQWVRSYAYAARRAADGVYLKLFSGSFGDGQVRGLLETYARLGAIYDGSLVGSGGSPRDLAIRRILRRLPGTEKEAPEDVAKKNLLPPLRRALPDAACEPDSAEIEPEVGVPVWKELDAYKVGPLSIRILETPKSANPVYSASFLDQRTARLAFELAHLIRLRSRFEDKYVRDFRALIDWRTRCAESQIRLLCAERLPKEAEWAVCSHAAYSSVGLRKYYALLVDDRVNEFYLDAPQQKAYLDHEVWNRCTTNIHLSEKDVEHFVTHLRRETNQRLDYSTPSMKADLSCSDFSVRASIDAFPLTRDGTAVDVRRYRRVPMTMLDLIANKTLNVESASFVLFCYAFRRTISVVGEPSSGKTTLVNAIDVCAPPWWRKVTVEDVVESVPQLEHGRHQIRIQVDPLEQGPTSRLKSLETTRLLHRNPTYVLLGEVQTAEHSRALFQALASGLRVIHTVHAKSSEGLIRRFMIQHNVSKEELKSLELVILIRNFMGFRGLWRKVTRISELTFDGEDQPVVNDIFRYDFESGELVPLRSASESETVRRIMEEYPLRREEVDLVLDSYKRFLSELYSKRGRLAFSDVVKRFDSFNAKIFGAFLETNRAPSREAVAGAK
ncbi:MAG: type II/IV secretion system ATPase subunit [Candidatus Brockarchaeota archaeon]|nr:type II/IV secretion system ATPase subunit [Candidatus Brockarchaeota archaeon]